MKEVVIVPNQLQRVLVSVALLLVLLHGVGYLPVVAGLRSEPIHFFNLDREQNFAAVYSTTLLWLCALLTGFIAKAEPDRARGRKWMGMAVVFALLGLDELVSLHERLSWTIHRACEGFNLHGFAWILPYALVLVVLLFVYAKFWWTLPGSTRLSLAIGGALFVGGGLGCELIAWMVTRMEAGAIAWHIEILAEEVLEMAGVIVMARAFLLHIADHLPEARLCVGNR